jgi:tetratricopeptide (TPR) repeat protein
MNLKTWYKESSKRGRKKAKKWQWYDNLFLGLIIIIFLISLIMTDWSVAFISGILTLVILLNYWKMILIKLASNNCKKEKYEKAHNQIKKVLKKSPKNLSAIILETQIYKKENKLQEALKCCNKGLNIENNNNDLLTLKVKILKDLGDYKKALNISNNILENNPYNNEMEKIKEEIEKQII